MCRLIGGAVWWLLAVSVAGLLGYDVSLWWAILVCKFLSISVAGLLGYDVSQTSRSIFVRVADGFSCWLTRL